MAAKDGQDSSAGRTDVDSPWHGSLNKLLADVEGVAADALQDHLHGCSVDEQDRRIYDISMSFISYMERQGLIPIDVMTGELLQDLSMSKWRSTARDFTEWLKRLELASSVGHMESTEELAAAWDRAVGFLQGSVPLRSTDPSSVNTREDIERAVRFLQDSVPFGSTDPSSIDTQKTTDMTARKYLDEQSSAERAFATDSAENWVFGHDGDGLPDVQDPLNWHGIDQEWRCMILQRRYDLDSTCDMELVWSGVRRERCYFHPRGSQGDTAVHVTTAEAYKFHADATINACIDRPGWVPIL